MRIIAGHHKGRRIRIPKNLTVRPTTDRAKEALFSILNHKIDFESTHVLDLYSGTGSIGFEFCSRGCPSVTSVDTKQACALFVENTAKDLDLPIRSIRMTAKNYLSKCVNDFDVIFADPPYDNGIENLKRSKQSLKHENSYVQMVGLFLSIQSKLISVLSRHTKNRGNMGVVCLASFSLQTKIYQPKQ
ncbi:MAG: hypothetical protein CM15mP32_1890 [Flavobacteriaceae bacterium]|nr:MAG: hypothetical protein CM15mP32_1890 [Flavobacteriaceae bacterium]